MLISAMPVAAVHDGITSLHQQMTLLLLSKYDIFVKLQIMLILFSPHLRFSSVWC